MKIYQQLGLAAAGACIVGVLNAQAQSPSSSADNAGLADIVVTAERREESLQKTPIAVTALSASMLEDANVRTTLDLMQVMDWRSPRKRQATGACLQHFS